MLHDRKYQLEARIARTPPPPRQNITPYVLAIAALCLLMIAVVACGIFFNPY